MERTSIPKFLLHVLKGRWIVVVFSFYIMSCAGATYIFGIYSTAIKTALQYDQTTIDTLSFFKDLGANVGIVSGLLNEVTPSWFVLAVGAGMNLFGYLMIWMATTHRIGQPPIWQMYLYMCVGANSQTFANTGVLVTCVKNFPQSRGVVLGLLKGFVGLSGAIFTQLYLAIYGQDTRGVILLVGWLPSLISLLFMFFIRPMKPEMDKNEEKHFFSFLYLALVLAFFLMLVIVVENVVGISAAAYQAMGVLTVLLVVANLCIGVKAEYEKYKQQPEKTSNMPLDHLGGGQELLSHAKNEPSKEKEMTELGQKTAHTHDISNMASSRHDDSTSPAPSKDGGKGDMETHADSNHLQGNHTHDNSTSTEGNGKQEGKPHMDQHPLSSNHQQSQHAEASTQTKNQLRAALTAGIKVFYSNWPQRGDDFTIPQALLSLDMWILFIATTAGVGATLTAIDNMGQIGTAQGYSQMSINTFVSLISIWNFLGRVIAGFSSEFLLQQYHFPRTLALSVVLALACVGHLMIAFPTPGSLYIASILVGLCFGAQWPLLFAVISELFGLKYYATLYNCGAVASPLGSYLLNVRVAGYLYDREARRQQERMIVDSGRLTAAFAPSPVSTIGSSDLKCTGAECFRVTFLIMTGVSLFGSLISLFLVARTRKFYSQDIYARFRKEGDGTATVDAKSLQL